MIEDSSQQGNLGKFYGVGIGPGDPTYLTVKAVQVFTNLVDVIFTVSGPKTETSVSESVVRSLPFRGKIVPLVFSMSRSSEERQLQVVHNAGIVRDMLKQGLNCAFATLGDTMTYSTFGYILKFLKQTLPDLQTEIIPGITSFATLSAHSQTVLVEDREQLRIIPAFKVDMVDSIEFPPSSTTVLMKTYKSRDALIQRLLHEPGISIVYGERLGMEDEFITSDPQEILKRPETYLSLMMVKKS